MRRINFDNLYVSLLLTSMIEGMFFRNTEAQLIIFTMTTFDFKTGYES